MLRRQRKSEWFITHSYLYHGLRHTRSTLKDLWKRTQSHTINFLCLLTSKPASVLFPFISPSELWPIRQRLLTYPLNQQVRRPKAINYLSCLLCNHIATSTQWAGRWLFPYSTITMPFPVLKVENASSNSPQIEEKIYSQSLWPCPWCRNQSHPVELGFVKHKEVHV
jgi:hypothetical protein